MKHMVVLRHRGVAMNYSQKSMMTSFHWLQHMQVL